MKKIEVVICIDASGKMRKVMPGIKADVESRYIDGAIRAYEKGKSKTTIRFVVFRDYRFDRKEAMQRSRKFSLPEERGRCTTFLKLIDAHGGGDMPECSIEALAFARYNDWEAASEKIIVMYSGSAPVAPGVCAECEGYPEFIPKNLTAFEKMWESDKNFKSESCEMFFYGLPECREWHEVLARISCRKTVDFA